MVWIVATFASVVSLLRVYFVIAQVSCDICRYTKTVRQIFGSNDSNIRLAFM